MGEDLLQWVSVQKSRRDFLFVLPVLYFVTLARLSSRGLKQLLLLIITKLVSALNSLPNTRQVFENPGTFDGSRVWKIWPASASSRKIKPSSKRILEATLLAWKLRDPFLPEKEMTLKKQHDYLLANKLRILLWQTIWFVGSAQAK